jgi:hypothetical protein
MKFNVIVPFLICAFSSSAFAIKVNTVTFGTETASRIETGATTTTNTVPTYTVYGGYAGAIGGCAAPSGDVVCNSCSGLGNMQSGNFSCAERSIFPTLRLAVTVTLDQLPPNPVIAVQSGTAGGNLVFDTSASTINGTSFTVYIPWSSLCGAANAGSCTTPNSGATADITVGLRDSTTTGFAAGAFQLITVKVRTVDPTVDTTAAPDHEDPIAVSGFSDFMVLPGDEKVYVTDIWRGAVGPDTNSIIKWQAMRIYYAEDVNSAHDFTTITYNGDNFATFNVENKDQPTDTKLSDSRLTGLENEVPYIFNIASVDETTIVSNFLKPTLIGDPAISKRYRATPGEVVGLLDNKECFIATAAFGSQMDDKVQLLREFRNQFLSPHLWGREFVRFYYQHSPPLAKYIAQHETLRTAVRWSLWPVIFVADLSLQYGALVVFALLLAFVLITTSAVIRIRRKA